MEGFPINTQSSASFPQTTIVVFKLFYKSSMLLNSVFACSSKIDNGLDEWTLEILCALRDLISMFDFTESASATLTTFDTTLAYLVGDLGILSFALLLCFLLWAFSFFHLLQFAFSNGVLLFFFCHIL